MRQRCSIPFAVLLSMLVAFAAHAGPGAGPASAEFEAIRAQQSQIRRDATARKGVFGDMPERTLRELLQRQDSVLQAIEGKQSAAELTESARLDVFNSLEWIEAAINRAEDDRMVCEQVATVGSNMKKRVCRTAAQARLERERAREELERGRESRAGN